MTALITAFLIAPGLQAQAQPDDDLPEDDGAPPEEYEPLPEGRTIEPPTRLAVEGEGPQSPPAHNAFPISGASRRSCSDSFGDPRSGGRTHMGVDCFAPLGTPLVAVEDGAIRYATPGGPYDCTTGGDISGNRVSLRGRSGYVYYYGHLNTILVATGQPVARGQVIGTVGMTGNAACSTAHLHFEVKCGEAGEPFDPYPPMATWGLVSPPAGVPSTESLGVGVSFSGTERQDLFALECGQSIRQRTLRPGGLSAGWASVDGIVNADPDAASPGAGREPELVVRGIDSSIYHLTSSGSAWYMSSLGGVCTSGPSAIFTGSHRLDVFCRGTDQELWQRFWIAGAGWYGWFRVGGIATSDPDAASPGPDHPPQVFVRGLDNAAYQLYWNGAGWGIVRLGGICTSGPSAAYSGPDRVDVFCRGLDLAIWHQYWTRTTGWSGWMRIESIIISDPEASSVGPGGSPQVFARGLDRQLYQFWWDGTTWVHAIWGVT